MAFALAEAMHLGALYLAGEVARSCGIRPWRDEDDPPMIAAELFEGIDWAALAEAAEEPLDLDEWRRWAAERFNGPESE